MIRYAAVAVVSLILGMLIVVKCSGNEKPKSEVTTKVDTIVVEKTVTIPKIEYKVINKNPKPSETFISKVKDTINIYDEVYTDTSGLVSVRVKDSIKGKLLSQLVDIKVKEREVKVKEITITKETTIKQVPSFSVYTGLTGTIGAQNIINIDLGIKTSKGWYYEAGVGGINGSLAPENRIYNISIKKDLFTMWK